MTWNQGYEIPYQPYKDAAYDVKMPPSSFPHGLLQRKAGIYAVPAALQQEVDNSSCNLILSILVYVLAISQPHIPQCLS